MGQKINSLGPGRLPREVEQGRLCSPSGMAGLCLRDAFSEVLPQSEMVSHLDMRDRDLYFQSEGK